MNLFKNFSEPAELYNFMVDSVNSNVISLTPGRWSDMTMLEGVWFVDFFAPWCPPCKAILPMFRAISKELKDINFGTVDCVAHGELCQKFNINAYPTKMIINGRDRHFF